MSALFIVRAQVVDPGIRDDFDRWYEDTHLLEARELFDAWRAWRGWSEVEPNVHYAFYEFEGLAAAQAISSSDTLKKLVAEFDRLWGERVVRTRDVVPTAQSADS